MRIYYKGFIMVLKKAKYFIKEYPSYTILVFLVATIIFGAMALALPICHNGSMSLLDILFTSASLTTVTGLEVVSFQNFTWVGKCIMLFLMQIGGLGLMTMTLGVISIFVDFGLYTQVLASEILSIQGLKDTKRILLFIIKLTLACELLGACAIFFAIHNNYSIKKALFLSFYHAVSSFCNVGTSLFTHGSLSYSSNIMMQITTTLLIFIGSLGFITWYEFSKIIKKWKQSNSHKVSWHTHLVLKTFFLTYIISSILFWLLERNNTLADMTPLQTFLNVILLGVSSKSTGDLPVAVNLMQPATILLLAVVAFIGSAPSSTGGGIKTSAFAIFLSVIRATVYGRSHAEIHGRRIERDQVYKAMAIIALAGSWILITLFCLLITEQNFDFIDVFLETISALSNNGLSTGITPQLSIAGKIFIIITMIAGRIGTLLLIIGMRRASDAPEILYPEERVILG